MAAQTLAPGRYLVRVEHGRLHLDAQMTGDTQIPTSRDQERLNAGEVRVVADRTLLLGQSGVCRLSLVIFDGVVIVTSNTELVR